MIILNFNKLLIMPILGIAFLPSTICVINLLSLTSAPVLAKSRDLLDPKKSISSTEELVKQDRYVSTLKSQVLKLAKRSLQGTNRQCSVSFDIMKNGQIRNLKMDTSSGNNAKDVQLLRNINLLPMLANVPPGLTPIHYSQTFPSSIGEPNKCSPKEREARNYQDCLIREITFVADKVLSEQQKNCSVSVTAFADGHIAAAILESTGSATFDNKLMKAIRAIHVQEMFPTGLRSLKCSVSFGGGDLKVIPQADHMELK